MLVADRLMRMSPRPQIDAEFRKLHPTSGAYRVRSGWRPKLLWSMDTTALGLDRYPDHVTPFVLNDGEHVVSIVSRTALAPGGRPLGDESVLVFLRRGTATRTWTLGDAVPGWRALRSQESVSSDHYEWFCGVELSEDERTLEITRCPFGLRRHPLAPQGATETLKFDTRSGARR